MSESHMASGDNGQAGGGGWGTQTCSGAWAPSGGGVVDIRVPVGCSYSNFNHGAPIKVVVGQSRFQRHAGRKCFLDPSLGWKRATDCSDFK